MKTCEHPDCQETNVTECTVVSYRGDLPATWHIRQYGLLVGLAALWQLWRHGHTELMPNYYCADHAQVHGYCFGCGQFWGGCENFDFDPSGLCEHCKEGINEDWTEDEWLAEWADYPGMLLA
jgi:hypothetical protein